MKLRKVVEAFILESDISYKPWGEVDKEDLLNYVINHPNKADKIYLKVENNWQESPHDRLSYPIADKNGTIYRYALSSAMGYAKTYHENGVIKKLKTLYKKYGLKDE